MIIKSKDAIFKMKTAGKLLAEMFEIIQEVIQPGTTTLMIDQWIATYLKNNQLVSQTKGYMGYQHVCCISVNQVVVHGVPSHQVILQKGDLVKVDVCAAWKGYCADMARAFIVGDVQVSAETQRFIDTGKQALQAGIDQAVVGNRLFDISYAIQQVIEQQGYGVVRDFAGHGIGKKMHEEPDVPNFGKKGTGMILRAGMTFAIEPMLTIGSYDVHVMKDGWTVETIDQSLAMHVEDTILITQNGPEILTRLQGKCV
ncbi:type I methionyl aminopeptidase [Candidatus Chromulinivorax destructor]|uniref:Methionine aminopeptidase n=1 Tax=Candidatus Chromulinivorax destructor TaxID=2066483 RepID=A0A345ZAY0_9BACT|nr:type I methionyl aminopeptidase [Candidatus Chromulinivorax destructor]AXK60447.1 type I methionyl aminopeptidase [Candidatus Chromulinivorax destructor]